MEALVNLETSKTQEKIRQQKNDLKKVEKEIDNYLNKQYINFRNARKTIVVIECLFKRDEGWCDSLKNL